MQMNPKKLWYVAMVFLSIVSTGACFGVGQQFKWPVFVWLGVALLVWTLLIVMAAPIVLSDEA